MRRLADSLNVQGGQCKGMQPARQQGRRAQPGQSEGGKDGMGSVASQAWLPPPLPDPALLLAQQSAAHLAGLLLLDLAHLLQRRLNLKLGLVDDAVARSDAGHLQVEGH